MSKLILNPEFDLYERNGQAFCSSRQVAEEFNRQHPHILRLTDEITQSTSGFSKDFTERNFALSKYKDMSGKWNKEYLMTKDGFAALAMEIKGRKARQFKEVYIRRFNDMEAFIKSLLATKIEFPAFTEAVMSAHEEPKHYHFSNEINMIYRIVLGVDAKKFREENGIEKGVVIKPYLSLEQIKAVEMLQRVDIGLLVAMPDFQQRKEALSKYLEQTRRKRIA